jgi:AraC family transcriptional regulator, positive regulator of tynA and feaB
MSAEQPIRWWSTKAVPPAMRFDYWQSTLQEALWPVSEWTDVSENFSVELREATLGCISSMAETAGPHRARRTRSDVVRSGESWYHLFLNYRSWSVAHHGHHEHLPGGSIVMLAEGEHETWAPSGFSGIILKCPRNWLASWLPDPELLAGRGFSKDSRWGRVLSPIISQLTPELAASPPLPASVMVDQLGALLALIAGGFDDRAMPDLFKRIQELVRRRCPDPQLTASHVSASLNVSPKALHRALAAGGRTFASMLLDARVSVALQMLESRTCNQLTDLEIATRSGFQSLAYFARVMRRRTGRSLSNLR